MTATSIGIMRVRGRHTVCMECMVARIAFPPAPAALPRPLVCGALACAAAPCGNLDTHQRALLVPAPCRIILQPRRRTDVERRILHGLLHALPATSVFLPIMSVESVMSVLPILPRPGPAVSADTALTALPPAPRAHKRFPPAPLAQKTLAPLAPLAPVLRLPPPRTLPRRPVPTPRRPRPIFSISPMPLPQRRASITRRLRLAFSSSSALALPRNPSRRRQWLAGRRLWRGHAARVLEQLRHCQTQGRHRRRPHWPCF